MSDIHHVTILDEDDVYIDVVGWGPIRVNYGLTPELDDDDSPTGKRIKPAQVTVIFPPGRDVVIGHFENRDDGSVVMSLVVFDDVMEAVNDGT